MTGHRCEGTESREFPGPFVRVRGRVTREGVVTWSPGLRTERGSAEPGKPVGGGVQEPGARRVAAAAVITPETFRVDFLDYRRQPVVSGPVAIEFRSRDAAVASFITRLPYHPETQFVQLARGRQLLGAMQVPTDRPFFTLLRPGPDDFVDGCGVLHIEWRGHDCQHPMTFFVRYAHDGLDWVRPGVNLKGSDYYLDLREMPGGERCVVQVLATNGYRTSYVETRRFEVTTQPPEILLGENGGPVLFAQGFSREHGPIVADGIVWLADQREVGRGGTFDARVLASGRHVISIAVTSKEGKQRKETVGTYDGATGLRLGLNP